jgi:DNA-binding beta-propeller fold protein YncE
VTRIDAPTGRVVATIPVAASPQAVAVDGGSVWVVGDAR